MIVSDEFRQEYYRFCANPLRSQAAIDEDLDALLYHNAVVSVAFCKPDILAIGTQMLIIEYKGLSYEIGEFIFFLKRERNGKIWKTNFRFLNITEELWAESGVMHPHIIEMIDDAIGDLPTGQLCIARGQTQVHQALRQGIMSIAFSALDVALRTYGTGKPFLSIEHWPILSEEEIDDRHKTPQ